MRIQLPLRSPKTELLVPLIPPVSASSLQSEQPLGHRVKLVREIGKIDP